MNRAPAAQDFVNFSRRSDLGGLEVMRARWVKHSFRPHAHDFYTVSLNYRGGGSFDCRGTQREAVPGTCNLMTPGEVHTGRATCEVGWIYRNLHIPPKLFGTLLQGLDHRGPLPEHFKAPLSNDTVLAHRLDPAAPLSDNHQGQPGASVAARRSANLRRSRSSGIL